MESELGFNINFDSAIQMSANWCRKPELVQESKMCRKERGNNKKNNQKWEYFNINVTQGVENVNTSSMCCPRLIKREKRMENVKN